MNKEQALQRLSAIEKETAELKKIIEAKDSPAVFQGRYLQPVSNKCFVVYSDGLIAGGHEADTPRIAHGSAFATREAAEQYAKHLSLMQEARIAMSQDWGDVKCDWSADSLQTKYCIEVFNGKAVTVARNNCWNQVHFRTQQACQDFFNKYTQEELKLMIMGVE